MSDNIIKRILFKNNNDDENVNLHHLIKKSEKKLTDLKKTMIMNILNLDNITVKDILVPRVDVESIDIDTDIKDIVKIIINKGHSRLIVYKDNIDNIIGILHAKDILKLVLKENGLDITKIIRPVIFVPDSKPIDDLFNELKEKKMHIAIVVDEYGGMSGIVCLEDIIEKIVGDILDEFDEEIEGIEKIDENIFRINPRISLDELNQKLKIDIDEDIDTLGGLILMMLGRIPNKNEKIIYKNFIFTIEAIEGRQIKTIKMEIKK